jgi:hypothetical protein
LRFAQNSEDLRCRERFASDSAPFVHNPLRGVNVCGTLKVELEFLLCAIAFNLKKAVY